MVPQPLTTHSATILTHTIACLHNLYSSKKQNIVVPKMMIFTNFKNSHKINKNSCTTMHVIFFFFAMVIRRKRKFMWIEWKKKIGALVTLYCNLNFIFIITLAILYCSSIRGTIYVKSLKTSTGVFSQHEVLSLEDMDSLKVH